MPGSSSGTTVRHYEAWYYLLRRACRHLAGHRFWRLGHRRKTAEPEQERGNDGVGDCDRRSDGKSNRFSMHKAEEGEQSPGQRKGGRFHELLLDDEDTNGAEHEAGENRAAAHNPQTLVEHAHLTELVHTDGGRVGPRRAERAVHQGLAP